jgi:hypothetical protein
MNNAEKLVKSIIPNAWLDRQKKKNGRYVFFVRNGLSKMYIGEGTTSNKAWKDALNFLKK